MTAPAALIAALADRYRIERELGQGGMATVYLAEDLKHHRKVAVKVLKPELAAVLGAERFVQEITTTAALQHPHILPLFDSGEAGQRGSGVATYLYYVMPFIDGETLRSKLDRETQLGIDESVKIATAVADALDHAHRHGIIHRDIKPENILLHDGRPMVADFGIALAVSAAAGGRMTETGLSLGTPHYMSPEQATAEKEITARSDVYSLASVLYEMLSGSPPHTGASAQQIIMKIVTEEAAPVTKLRKAVPANVAAAVAKALEKLPADRFDSARAFADALSNPTFVAPTGGATSRAVPRRRGALLPWGVAALAAVGAGWGWLRPMLRPVARVTVGFQPGQALGLVRDFMHLAVSADGNTLVYTGDDSASGRLWVKYQGDLDAVPIPGTEGAFDPFLSPDGRQVGFFANRDGSSIERVALAGGMPQVVTTGVHGVTGASWAADGYIYFDDDLGGLLRVRPDGSGREPVLALDTTQHEVGIAWPQVLPGSRIAIMRLRHASDDPSEFSIIAVRLGTGERATLIRAVSARYAAGRLLYVTADGTLSSSAFDEHSLKLSGDPTILATGVRVAGTWAGVDLEVSAGGTVYYVAGPEGHSTHLRWVARDGTSEPVDTTWQASGSIKQVTLSPDGSRAVFEVTKPGARGGDIWVKQLPHGPVTRLTLDAQSAANPTWIDGGRSVVFAWIRVQAAAAFVRRADGLGVDSMILRSDRTVFEVVQSRDRQWLVAVVASSRDTGDEDILVRQIGPDTTLRPLIAGPAREFSPSLSPDGHWIAYVSTASGRPEVYVQPFPDVDRGRWQVSVNGGFAPRWSQTGRTLYFWQGREMLLSADVTAGVTFTAGTPRPVLRVTASSGLDPASGYDVSGDESRFLMVGKGAVTSEPQLVRIENIFGNSPRRKSQ